MIKAVRGTRDLLPPDTALWNHVERIVRDVFRAYNFQEIRTPIFEATELFARGVGEETDIVSKEMYTSPDPKLILERAWLESAAANYTVIGRKRRPKGFNQEVFSAQTKEGAWELIAVEAEASNYQTVLALRKESSAFKVAQLGSGDIVSCRLVIVVDANRLDQARKRLRASDVEVRGVEISDPPEYTTLRPENTAGVVRAYIEHKLWDRGLNKLYYIGPQFRRERPQKGRYRQFYQIGAEVIGPASAGSESPARDAEVLEMLATLLDRLGIKNWTLELNSVGTPADRAHYNEELRKALAPIVPSMCEDCQRRAVTNPLRVFDCKVPEDQPKIETLPRISQFLGEDSKKHFAEVQAILTATGVPFTLNNRLVRGLDYYTRTAFEFTHGALGAQNAILGGGRYDGLSEALGGPAAPGIGFAIGEDRLVMSLPDSAESVYPKPDVYIAPLGQGMNREAALLARELRRHDLIVEFGDENFRLKKSFDAAAKLVARNVLIVGENEVKSGTFTVKNQQTGEQVSVPLSELAAKLKADREKRAGRVE